MKPGTRVGAMLGASKEAVDFLGYGVYEGDFVFGDEASGDVVDMAKAAAQERGSEIKNPRIRLDNGDVVWGAECWWGPEDRMKAEVAKYPKVNEIRIADARAQAAERRKARGN